MSEQSSEKKWYILQTSAGYEARVKLLIEKELKLQGQDAFVEEIFIPSEEVTSKKNDKTRKVTYYPGYIFIKMIISPDLISLLRGINRVSGFIGGTKENPVFVPESEINKILDQIQNGIKQTEADSTFQVGDKIIVIEGPFAEFNGTIDNVDKEHSKLSVLVNIFGRPTPLELSFDKVKPIE